MAWMCGHQFDTLIYTRRQDTVGKWVNGMDVWAPV